MLNIHRTLKNDRLLRALTGLSRKAFDEWCEVFAAVYQATLENDPKPRKRARGAGMATIRYCWQINQRKINPLNSVEKMNSTAICVKH